MGKFGVTVTVVALLAVAGYTAILVTRTPDQAATLWTEVGKGLVQLLAIGVAGTILKLLADEHLAGQETRRVQLADERLREERRAEFRREIHGRLVSATNAVRRAPILIEANRSVRTWSEQMLAIVDTGFELSLIQHEISSSRVVPDPPFSDDERELITDVMLPKMRRFVDAVAADFAASKRTCRSSSGQPNRRTCRATSGAGGDMRSGTQCRRAGPSETCGKMRMPPEGDPKASHGWRTAMPTGRWWNS